MVTTQADWSLDFDIGMNFFEWHAPVPLAHEKGIFVRALKFLLNIQQGAPARRLNWTMTVNPLLDTSPENYHKWGIQKTGLTAENIGAKQHLAGRAANLLEATAFQRPALPDPLLPVQFPRYNDSAEMGTSSASRHSRLCPKNSPPTKGSSTTGR